MLHVCRLLLITTAVILFPKTLAYRRIPTSPDGNRFVSHESTKELEYEDLLETIRQHNRHLQSRSNKVSLPSPEDHLVADLPYLNPQSFTTRHYAGHIPASQEDDKKLFYWLFEPDISSHPEITDSDIPLLIWLNGGPGCSSMDGLFIENGPLKLVPPSESHSDWSIQTNEYSWHKAPAYMLYIDQPVGTGLSFTKKKKYCKNDQEINLDFYVFLQNFLHVHEDKFVVESNGRKQMNRKLYFSGESHAGHYIPSMMDFILQRNSDTDPKSAPEILIHLAGAAIGNGWTDPMYQYSATEIGYGLGAIDLAQKQTLDDLEATCQSKLKQKIYSVSECNALLDYVIVQTASSTTTMSVYDNRIRESKIGERDFPKGHKDVERYLGGWTGRGYPTNMNIDYKLVLDALHASESISAGQRYLECTDPPYDALSYQDGKGVVNEVVNILNHPNKVRMLFFNGINDMICNHVGNENYLDNLPWDSVDKWITANRYSWTAAGALPSDGPSGFMKEYDNLSFLKILNSGHMVSLIASSVSFCRIFLTFDPSIFVQRYHWINQL